MEVNLRIEQPRPFFCEITISFMGKGKLRFRWRL